TQSHTVMVSSQLPAARVRLSGLKATVKTGPACPRKVAFSSPLLTSQTLAVSSRLPDARSVPSLEKARQRTCPPCALGNVARGRSGRRALEPAVMFPLPLRGMYQWLLRWTNAYAKLPAACDNLLPRNHLHGRRSASSVGSAEQQQSGGFGIGALASTTYDQRKGVRMLSSAPRPCVAPGRQAEAVEAFPRPRRGGQ